ncbi:hypothetical protein AB0I49_38140 [Streptomyces sp. NPDC050617]|uniref:hypothetical protein n=1 Tax=Streptomyces sp. NPDC050617 TaxID=3154628 RepID=UPI003419DC33
MSHPLRRSAASARLRGAMLVSGAFLTVASCTAGGGGAAGESSAPPSPPAGNATPSERADPIALPLDRYFLSTAERKKLLSALDVLVAACMKQADVKIPPATKIAAEPPRYERRYGISNSQEAILYGYHRPERPADNAPPITERQKIALTGTPDGNPGPGGSPPKGCQATAAQNITGSDFYPADPLAVRQLNVDSFEQSKQDGLVRAALRKWSACMRSSGFSYATPLDSPNSMAPGPRPSEREISTARTDIACKKKTRLIDVWQTAESTYQHQLIKERHKSLALTQRERATQLDRATRVLADSDKTPTR